jgi:hypothetical protein
VVVGVVVGVEVGTGVLEGFSAVTIACSSALVSVEKEPIPPVLFAIAVCNLARVTPVLLETASAPWHPAQLAAYRRAPSGVEPADGEPDGDDEPPLTEAGLVALPPPPHPETSPTATTAIVTITIFIFTFINLSFVRCRPDFGQ